MVSVQPQSGELLAEEDVDEGEVLAGIVGVDGDLDGGFGGEVVDGDAGFGKGNLGKMGIGPCPVPKNAELIRMMAQNMAMQHEELYGKTQRRPGRRGWPEIRLWVPGV